MYKRQALIPAIPSEFSASRGTSIVETSLSPAFSSIDASTTAAEPVIEATGAGVAVGVASGMGLGELVLLGFALPLGSPPSLVQAVAATKNTQHRLSLIHI